MKIYQKINGYVEKALGIFMAIFLSAMVIVITVQVFCRYVLNIGLPWSEELARFTNIWLVLMGATVAFLQRSHIRVNIIEETWKSTKGVLNLVQDVIIFAFCIVLTYFSFTYMEMGSKSVSSGLQINMGWIYLSFPVCGCFMVLFSLFNVIDAVMRLTGHTGKEKQA